MPIQPIETLLAAMDTDLSQAAAILDETPMFFLPDFADKQRQVFVWNDQVRRYENQVDQALGVIHTYLVNQNRSDDEARVGKVTLRRCRDILQLIKQNTTLDLHEVNPNEDEVLLCRNGRYEIFNLATLQYRPNTPRDYVLTAYDFTYDPTVMTCPPIFRDYLNSIHPNPFEQYRIIQLLRAVISGDLRKHDLSLWTCGYKRTGKGVLQALITSMIGPRNHTNLSLNKTSDKFAEASFFNSRLNCSADDVCAHLRNDAVEFLKTMISYTTEVSARRFGDTEKNFKNLCTFMFAMNFLPQLMPSYDHASVLCRIALIVFEHRPKALDTTLSQRLKAAKNDIASWLLNQAAVFADPTYAVDGEAQLWLQTPTQYTEMSLDDLYRLWSDPIYRILRGIIVKDTKVERMYVNTKTEYINDLIPAEPIIEYVVDQLIALDQGTRKTEYIQAAITSYVQSLGGIAKLVQRDNEKNWYYDRVACTLKVNDRFIDPVIEQIPQSAENNDLIASICGPKVKHP